MDDKSKNLYEKLLIELFEAGYPVKKVQELPYLYKNYSKLIPILSIYLEKFDDIGIKEEIVRAMAVKFAKPAAKVLINEFIFNKEVEPTDYLWAIGNSISVIEDDAICNEVIELIKDRGYSVARQMMVMSLWKMRDANNQLKVKSVLIELLDDDDVAAHAIYALGRLKAIDAIPAIEPFLKHKLALWRNEAKKAILRIEANNSK